MELGTFADRKKTKMRYISANRCSRTPVHNTELTSLISIHLLDAPPNWRFLRLSFCMRKLYVWLKNWLNGYVLLQVDVIYNRHIQIWLERSEQKTKMVRVQLKVKLSFKLWLRTAEKKNDEAQTKENSQNATWLRNFLRFVLARFCINSFLIFVFFKCLFWINGNTDRR